MAQCDNCLRGYCKRHPLQDHGKRSTALLAKAKDMQKTSISDLLKQKLASLQAEARSVANAAETDVFRAGLELDRAKAEQSFRSSSAGGPPTKYVQIL